MNQYIEESISNQRAIEFIILKNGIKQSIEIIADKIQPNKYSKYPKKEIAYLIDQFFTVIDKIKHNPSYFDAIEEEYKQFLIDYFWRYSLINKDITFDVFIDFVNKYQSVSTSNLVNQSINHKSILN